MYLSYLNGIANKVNLKGTSFKIGFSLFAILLLISSFFLFSGVFANGTCTDTENSTNSTRTITIDSTAPITTATAVDDAGSSYTFNIWTNSTYVNVTLSCDDGIGIGCNITQYCTDTVNTCTPDTDYSTPVKIETENTSYIRYRSKDTLSNLETIKNQTITIDSTAPITTATAVDDAGSSYTFNIWTNSTYVNVTLSCDDGIGIGCNITQYCTDTVNTCTPDTDYSTPVKIETENTSYIRYRSKDTLSNLETIKNQTIFNTENLSGENTPKIKVGFLECDKVLYNPLNSSQFFCINKEYFGHFINFTDIDIVNGSYVIYYKAMKNFKSDLEVCMNGVNRGDCFSKIHTRYKFLQKKNKNTAAILNKIEKKGKGIKKKGGKGKESLKVINSMIFNNTELYLEYPLIPQSQKIKINNQTLNYFEGNITFNISEFIPNEILFKLGFGTVTVSASSMTPANLTQTTDITPDFTFTPTSDVDTTFSCELFIDDVGNGVKDSIQNNTPTTITANSTLSNGDHSWYINCTDASGTTQSEIRTIGIGDTFSRCAVLVDSASYYMNGSITNSTISTCINIQANNVTLDCQGHTIDGNFSLNGASSDNKYAVYSNQYNTTIKNCIISNWQTGIYLDTGANNSEVKNNTIQNLYGATSGGNAIGIHIKSTSNKIYNNTISSLTGGTGGVAVGVWLDTNSYNNIITPLSGNSPDESKLNTIEGKPILYFYNKTGLTISNFNITVSTIPILIGGGGDGGTSTGLALINVTNSLISNNTISGFTGMSGGAAENHGSGGTGGTASGIYLSSSTNNNLSSNTISNLIGGAGGAGGYRGSGGTGGTASGIYLSSSTNNNLSSNTISNLTGGTGGTGGSQGSGGTGGTASGIYLSSSTNNNLLSNTISSLTGGVTGGGTGGGTGVAVGVWLDTNSYDNIITPLSGNSPDESKLNTIDGKPILYLYNKTGLTISNFNITVSTIPILIGGSTQTGGTGGTGGTSTGLALINVTNSTISNNTLSGFTGMSGGTGGYYGSGGTGGKASGIYLSSSTNNNLSSNTISFLTGGTGGTGGYESSGGTGGKASGIYLSSSTNNNLSSNTISFLTGGTGGTAGVYGNPRGTGGTASGIYLSSSTNNNLSSNIISNLTGGAGGTGGTNSGGAGGTASGIYLSSSTNNNLSSNTISNLTGGTGGTAGAGGTASGIYLSSSTNNNLSSNTISNLTGGTGEASGVAVGVRLDTNSYNNIITPLSGNSPDESKLNTIEGKPILYFYNKTGLTISNFNIVSTIPILIGSKAIGLALINVTNSTISNNTLSGFTGMSGGTGGGTGGTATGLYLSSSTNNNLSSNTISSLTGGTGGKGGWYGTGGAGGTAYGIYLYSSTNNNLSSNTISSLTGGAGGTAGDHGSGGAGGTAYGIYLYLVSDSLIYNNLINVTNGVGFAGTIYNNWNTTKQTGIRIYSNGTQIGGNYWTNSTGNGYSDTCTDSDQDGFCDDYYNLTTDNIDWLPLSDEYLDATPPTYTNVGKNDTDIRVNDVVIFYTKWFDTNLDSYIFSWNHSGSWVNDSAVSLTEWSNVTKTITATGKPTIGWIIYANDSVGNCNNTGIQSFTINNTAPTTPTDLTLTPTVKVGETLTGTCSDSTDADGDSITYFYEFYNNNDSAERQSYSSDNTYVIQTIDAHDTIRVRCIATTSDANSTYDEETKQVSDTPTTITLNAPTDGGLLYRDTSPTLNITVTDPDSAVDIKFINASDNEIICTNNTISSGSNVLCTWSNLTPNTNQTWYVNATENGITTTSSTWSFIPNDEPTAYNMRIEKINESSILLKWGNELDMEWISFKVGNDILELRKITAIDNEWNVKNMYANQEYEAEWQIGDNLTAMSDYNSFNFRTKGWMPDLVNYGYKRLVTINSSEIASDLDGYGVNITLTEDNFKYTESWVDYPSFQHLNWSNFKDIRFVDYYEVNYLDFNITHEDVNGDGGIWQQTIPNSTAYTGTFIDYDKAHDGKWNTQAIPDTYGVDYYNYTIPAKTKTSSKFRLYDGGWYWDVALPSACFGGTDLEFKSEANYTAPSVKTYCKNQSDSSWILIRTQTSSSYIYETMMTWIYECEVDITIIPEHFDDATQTNIKGIDGDYNTKFWIYYGYSDAISNESSISPNLLQDNHTIGDEEPYVPSAPVISNIEINTSSTGANITWDVDQSTDNRIKYATNKWLLGSTWTSRIENKTEQFKHIYADGDTTDKLLVFSDYYISIVDVSCSNASYNSNYTINTSLDPVEITFKDVNDANYYDWNVTYTFNKTYDRATYYPIFITENLATNTKYYYQIESYGTTYNTTETGDFTLGTLPSVPSTSYVNYTEDRPNENITVCFNLTDLNSNPSVNCSVQYWNESSEDFGETSVTNLNALGTFCKEISVDYGHNYSYRAKCAGTTTGYSSAYSNEFMPIQEFFAGSYIEDDNDDRTRQYCPLKADGTVNLSAKCYEQKGYWEGSQQEEDWIWIETNETTKGALTVVWYNGTAWSDHSMTNEGNYYYLKLENLGTSWQTFYIKNSTETIMNWTKPSTIHLNTKNRTDTSKYVSFNGTKEPIDYLLLYMTPSIYNSSAYEYCMASPNGNLYDCMSVEYFGGGSESGITSDMAGTAYDRGRLFRGGIINGELDDSGTLNPTLDSNRAEGEFRECFAFTVYWFNKTLIPDNNVTNYYYHYWRTNVTWSEYFGYTQDFRFDYNALFNWKFDLISNTRDWKMVTDSNITTENTVLSVNNSVFNMKPTVYNNYGSNLPAQSLTVGYDNGFKLDLTNPDDIYNFGFYTDGRWTNQQLGKYQQGFIIFNLPSNTTLQGMDTDSDGLTDYDELFIYYTNPKMADTDEDGRADGVEVSYGYEPNLYTSSNTAPTIIANTTSPDTIYTDTDFKLNLTITDIDVDTLTGYVQFYVNDSSSGSVQSSPVTNNTNTLIGTLANANFNKGDILIAEYWAGDGTINITKENTTVIVSNSAPIISPTLTILSKDANGTAYIYDYNATDADGDSLTWYDNTTLFNINSSTGIINDTPIESEAGSYEILINVSDGTSQDTDLFTYQINDTTPPSIIILSPIAYNYYNNNLVINTEITDLSNISYAYYNITNSTNLTITGELNLSNNWDAILDTTTVIDGNYFLSIWANDTVGNENNKRINFTIDNTNPQILNFTISKNSIKLGNSITLVCYASDNLGDVNINLTRNDVLIKTCYSSPCVSTYTPTSTGTKTLKCTAYDDASNYNTSTKLLTVNSEPSGSTGGESSYIPLKEPFYYLTFYINPINRTEMEVYNDKNELTMEKVIHSGRITIPLVKGKYRLKIMIKGYELYEVNLLVEKAGTYNINLKEKTMEKVEEEVKEEKYLQTFKVYPSIIDLEVYKDDKLLITQKLRSGDNISLPKGEYSVILKAEGYSPYKAKLIVHKDAEYEITLNPIFSQNSSNIPPPPISNNNIFYIASGLLIIFIIISLIYGKKKL